MSLDYPFYEELCRRGHRAAWWWLIGDRLYYLGLLPALLALPGGLLALGAGIAGGGWHWLIASAVVFVAGVVVHSVGVSLKKHAYHLAREAGISDTAGYQQTPPA